MNVTRNRVILKFMEDHKRELGNLVHSHQPYSTHVVTTINLVFDAVEAKLFTDDDSPSAVYDAILNTFRKRYNIESIKPVVAEPNVEPIIAIEPEVPVEEERKKSTKLNRVEILEKFLVDHKDEFDTLNREKSWSYSSKNPVCAKLIKAAKALNIYSKTSTEQTIFGSLMNMNAKGVNPVTVNRMGKRRAHYSNLQPSHRTPSSLPSVRPIYVPPVVHVRPEAEINPVNVMTRDIRDLGLTSGAMKIIEAMLSTSIETKEEWHEYVINGKPDDNGIKAQILMWAYDDLVSDRYDGFRDYNLPLIANVKLSDYQMVFNLGKFINDYINRCADEFEMDKLWGTDDYIIPCAHPRPERHYSREIDGQHYVLVYPEPVPQVGDLVMYRDAYQDVKASEVLQIVENKYLYLRNESFVPINQAYVAMYTTPPPPFIPYSEKTMTVREAMMALALMDPDAVLMFQDDERVPITIKSLYAVKEPKPEPELVTASDEVVAPEVISEETIEEPKTKFILLRG